MGRSHHNQFCDLDVIEQFDDIIDVRTPAEFADDHITGAINAPVLSNEERVLIGTTYKQESAFKAKRMGAALVARHIAEHMETLFADKPKNWRPLIYCWRGGKRSESMVKWFNMVGWRACQLAGGYKSWRRHVMGQLIALPPKLSFIVLAGPTGSGKTRLLQNLEKAGAQVLDLEDLAKHRGSLLGNLPDEPQPSQRHFETLLFEKLASFNPAQPVFVEAESRRVGQRDVTQGVIDAIHLGRCIKVKVNQKNRLDFLLTDYQHLFDNPSQFKEKLNYLIGLHSKSRVNSWHELIDQNQRRELFKQLIELHYDPAYRRSSHSNYIHLPTAEEYDYDPTGPQTQAQQLLQKLHITTP